MEKYKESRKRDYEIQITPDFQEAVMEYLAGRRNKMMKLLEKVEQIKMKYPKPDGINDDGEEEWL